VRKDAPRIVEAVRYPDVVEHLKALAAMPAARCPVPKNQIARALRALKDYRAACLELAESDDSRCPS
jgi:hypothetical protein